MLPTRTYKEHQENKKRKRFLKACATLMRILLCEWIPHKVRVRHCLPARGEIYYVLDAMFYVSLLEWLAATVKTLPLCTGRSCERWRTRPRLHFKRIQDYYILYGWILISADLYYLLLAVSLSLVLPVLRVQCLHLVSLEAVAGKVTLY